LTALALIGFVLPGEAFAQEIKAHVSVSLDLVQPDFRYYASTMANDLERYINSQKFTDVDWTGDPIPVDINIYLSGGAGGSFTAKLLVVGRRNLDGPTEVPAQSAEIRFFDDKWAFDFAQNANLAFNNIRFDYFNTLIDMYMLMVIGFDLDSYNSNAGSRAFEAARNLFQLGANKSAPGYETYSQPGDMSRYNILTDITDMRNQDLRALFLDYYRLGLDKIGFDKAKGTQGLADVISRMADFKQKRMTGSGVLMQLFFDTKAQELGAIFNGYADEQVFKDLMYLDPSNSTIYRDSQEGKLK
jgi:hypothetical protein